MWKKRWFLIVFVIVAIILIAIIVKRRIGRNNSVTSELTDMKICVASDIHYISPELTDNGRYFIQLIENSDGKAMQYCEEITDTFVAEIIEQKPDVLVISGDLTFNGAKASHQAFSAKIRKIQEAGTKVLVIPGNHDINCNMAASFKGDSYELVESINSDEFASIYSDFGYAGALSRDNSSLSYTYEAVPGLIMLMVDVNTEDSQGVLKDSTYQWISKQLEEASKSGKHVIAVSHQNLLAHNSLFVDGFIMGDSGRLCTLYEKYGVMCNLSGHMHIQHIAESNGGVKDIATSSLIVSPCQYGVIDISVNGADYHTVPLKFHHANEAELFMRETSFRLIRKNIDNPSIESCNYFADFNGAYFAGRTDLINWDEGIYEAIRQKDSLTGIYMKSVHDDGFRDHTKCSF